MAKTTCDGQNSKDIFLAFWSLVIQSTANLGNAVKGL